MTGRGHFPRSTQNVPQGTQLNNMFEIDELVTAGGMGEVYRGHNIQTHDPVAIKIVLPEFAQDELILELFRKEARILNHLHHEAIVRYYVFSIDATLGLPFLVMEFVDGPSLAERIKSGPFDTASVATLQRHLADGLEKSHQAGVIHRDIAPDNIILPEGRVDRAKIIDFGIARSAAAGGGTLLGGQFAGKYNFVSPEQLGLFDGNVTNRSDIYSLGLVLAACALGKPLDMSGSQVAVIEKRRTVPDLTGIAPALRGLIAAMLQPDPQDRPQSMAEVAAWPTYEDPEPQDFEKTRIYTTPPSRQPSRPPGSHPSHARAELAQESSRPPSSATGSPLEEPHRDVSWPPPAAAPPQRTRPVERRREKRKSRAGLVAGGLAVTAFLLAGVGGWAYVEYWSGAWYQDESLATAEAEPEILPEPAPQEFEPEEPGAQEPEAPVAEAQEPESREPEAQEPPAPEPPVPEAEAPEAEVPEPEAPQPEAPQPETAGPEAPATAAPEPRFTAADVRDHVNSHPGGNCYFAFPAEVGDNHAEIVGYGSQRMPFDALRESVRTRFGFDAAIDVRTVSNDQCIVVDALGQLAAAGAAPVALDLSHSVLRSGGSLSGTISDLGKRHLSLLMLDNFGFVHDLAGYVTREDGTATFRIDELTTANQMDFEPQLVLSIASAEPLQSLDLAQSLPASELIPALLEEIASKPEGLATDVGYFKFGS